MTKMKIKFYVKIVKFSHKKLQFSFKKHQKSDKKISHFKVFNFQNFSTQNFCTKNADIYHLQDFKLKIFVDFFLFAQAEDRKELLKFIPFIVISSPFLIVFEF